jgi:hypothetical protein
VSVLPACLQGVVCGQEHFTKIEDRPIVKERRTLVQEHHPVEKEFVVSTVGGPAASNECCGTHTHVPRAADIGGEFHRGLPVPKLTAHA